MTTAAQRWAEGLAAWAIPDAILEAAPESPWGFDPAVFTAAAAEALRREADTPSDAAARTALPVAGSVLDVGTGGGAAGLRLHADAGLVVGVDPSAVLLAAFEDQATRLRVPHRTVVGSWPEALPEVPRTDVVVCHHVTYNVPELSGFAAALAAAARRRVVIEMTAEHPLRWMNPLWVALHDLPRPDGPTADDAVAVLEELGWVVDVQRWARHYDPLGEGAADALGRLARRLCLPADRHDELRALLDEHPPPREREVVTLVSDVG